LEVITIYEISLESADADSWQMTPSFVPGL